MRLQQDKQKIMMTNNNTYPSRFNPMSVSSTFNGPNNLELRRFNPFPNNITPFDPFQRNQDTNHQQPKKEVFPKAMASQSMIASNSASSARRTTFGKLDSMARKVTTTFQEENAPQPITKLESQTTQEDSTTQSMISSNNGGGRSFFGANKFHQKKMNTEPAEPPAKKRRESIDLGYTGRMDPSSEMLPFMRRMPPNEVKVEKPIVEKPIVETEVTQAYGLDAMKQKNFEFLKKRKEATGPETTSSVILPNSMHGVQSMKNLYQFNQQNALKKSQFLSPVPKQPANDVKCPQDKYQVTSSFNTTPPTGNFQFKKKKAFEAPIEVIMSKSPQPKDEPKEPLTAKQRRNARNQRQIKLSDFQILQKLGKGAFGEVFMAQQKNIGFICVIKKMSKKRIRETKVQNHILREIKIQSYLNHANLTALFGYFHDEEYLYLIIEALPDGSLQQVKKKKKLPEKEAAAIIKQVSVGLKYMHEQSVIHRDLKPQNLFVNENVIKLGDFGCSIYNQGSGLRTTVVGCLQYSSPQQLCNQGYSQKIDAWSLGILTYQLLFGKSPFQKDIINITKNKQVEAKLSQLSFPPSIPIKDQTKDFIENLLAENPDKRMDMDEVLNHPFLREEMSKKMNKLELI